MAGIKRKSSNEWEGNSLKKRKTELEALLFTDLVEVLDLLRSHGYSGVSYYELGLYLGLNSATLDVITKNNKDYVENCLRECLNKWLLKADNVQMKGGPTIYSLVSALRKLGENGVADGIDMEKHPACKILAHCADQQSSLVSALPQLVRYLHTAKLIKERIPSTDIQGEALLTEIKEAVCNDYRKLKALAEILLKNSVTAEIGTVIIKEYREVYCSNELRHTDSICPKFDFPPTMAKVLKLLRFKRSNMFKNVGSIIEDKCNPDSTVIDIRDILRFYSSTFRKQLAQCQSIHDTLELISDNSSLTDICMLESLVGKLNIDEAKEVVRDYNEAVEELNKKDLTQSLEEILSNISPLQCETITILVDKKDAELILDDVTIYLRNLFLKLSPHIRVYANDIDNSVNITCSFPLILSEQLITAALNNIDVLKENKVKRLTIGYCTVYEVNDTSTDTTTDLDEHQFSILISTRSGLLKQLMLSLSVQLNNSKEEVDALNEEIMTMKKEAESLKEEAESLKEETKSFKETLDTKNKILRVSIAESERFKKMAAETSQLLQEKVSQLTEREEENKKLKKMREVLEEQLALFQAEKEGEHNERIEQHAEVSHQHVNEVKSNEEIELLQEKISRMSLQLIEKDNQLQEKEYQLKLTMDKLTRITEQLQNSLKQAESRENTLQEKISQMSQENEAKIQEMEEKLFQKGSQIEILKGRLSSSHFERQENLEFKDAIYGFIKIEHPLLIKIVKTEQFARLKSIGCIYHDKSKAHYSRYDYCIGMYYFAGKFVKTLRKRQPVLNITDSDVLCVEIAALCYNLGHGPFSHTFADFLKEIKASRRYWKGLRANVMMFQHMIEVNRLPFNEYFDNPEQDIEFIKELMTGKQGPQATLRKDKVFLYEIVVNKMSGLDVNRMDYTMRDAVVLGKRINFKWRKFLNKIRVEICPDGKKHICANEEDLGTYNELFADRHALFKELYFERKNRTVATMINRILSKCGEAEFIKGPDGKWLSLIDAIKTMDTYCCLNEEILEVINETIADPEVEKLIKFLSNSKLLIPIGYVKNCQLAGGIQQLKEEIIENEDGLSQDDIIVDVAKSGYERATREYMYYISHSGTVKQWTKEWHAPPADTSAPWRVFYTKHNKELVATMKRGLRRVIDEKGGEVDTYDNETDVSDLIPEEEPAASQ